MLEVDPANKVGRVTGSPVSSQESAEPKQLGEKTEIGLDDLLRIAELNNPEVQAAWEKAGAAAGRAWQAELYPNPSIELEAEDIPADNVGLSRSENKVAIVQPLIVGKRRAASIAAAAAEREARHLDIQAKLRGVQGALRLLYAELLYFKQAADLHEELLAVARETLQIARVRFDARAAPESEVIQCQIEVHDIELRQRRLQRQFEASTVQLNSMLGGFEVPVERLAGSLEDNVPELNLERQQTVVHQNHPAVLALIKDIEAADRRVEQAEAERVPDVGLRVAYGRNGVEDENVMEAGVSIPLPIFNRNQGRILEARHLVARMRRERETLVNNLLSELAAAHASYMTARDEVETYRDQIVPAAERAFSQAKERYQAGKTSLLEILDAQRTLTKARLFLLESLKDANVARATLWKIVGPELDEGGREP